MSPKSNFRCQQDKHDDAYVQTVEFAEAQTSHLSLQLEAVATLPPLEGAPSMAKSELPATPVKNKVKAHQLGAASPAAGGGSPQPGASGSPQADGGPPQDQPAGGGGAASDGGAAVVSTLVSGCLQNAIVHDSGAASVSAVGGVASVSDCAWERDLEEEVILVI